MGKSVFFFTFFISFNFLSAQSNTDNFSSYSNNKKINNWIIDYPENTDLPFTDLEIKKLQYAYGESLKKNVLDKPSMALHIKHLLRNRIFIDNKLGSSNSDLSLLSSVDLFNLYNKEIVRPVFNKDEFNPLIYNLNFYSKSDLIYRVDGTDYIIKIKSRFKR